MTENLLVPVAPSAEIRSIDHRLPPPITLSVLLLAEIHRLVRQLEFDE